MQTLVIARSRFDRTLLAVMDQFLEKGRIVTDAPLGNLQIINWNSGCLEIASEHGFEPEFLSYFARVDAADSTCCGRALHARSQTVLEDVEADLVYPQEARMVMLDAGARSCQSTPLISTGGALVGILSTHFPTAHRPSVREMEDMQSLATAAADRIIQYTALGRAVGEAVRASCEALASSKELLCRLEQESKRRT